MYYHRVFNLKTKSTFVVKSIKDFARRENLNVELDKSDNFFYQNLKNMTQQEYLKSDSKHSLVFEYDNYVIYRVSI